MALELYTLVTILVNGNLLTEESEVAIDRDSRAQDVYTVHKGFAGLSPGAGVIKIDVGNAVPSTDFELDPGKFFVDELEVVEITLFAASRRLTSKGFIPKDSLRHGVNAESKLGFSFIGQPAKWE